MKEEAPAILIILFTIILAIGYSVYQSISEHRSPNFKLCPLCSQEEAK